MRNVQVGGFAREHEKISRLNYSFPLKYPRRGGSWKMFRSFLRFYIGFVLFGKNANSLRKYNKPREKEKEFA